MTTITNTSSKYTIRFTDSVNEKCIEIGKDIAGMTFYADAVDSTKPTVRGYILEDGRLIGPFTLNKEDLE